MQPGSCPLPRGRSIAGRPFAAHGWVYSWVQALAGTSALPLHGAAEVRQPGRALGPDDVG